MDGAAALIEAWDDAHWEFRLAFEGLSDEDLWTRPHPKLLSVGELAGHVAWYEAMIAGGGSIKSRLAHERFSHYDDLIDNPVRLDLTVQQVIHELDLVHKVAKQMLQEVRALDETVPWMDDFSWMQTLSYSAFHVAYHCGQAYSVRHLLGHRTPDN